MGIIERLYCTGKVKGKKCVAEHKNGFKPECITTHNMQIVPVCKDVER